jgi:hypothetical protein
MKIHLVGAKMFHACGQTDMILTVVFHNFANTPKNKKIIGKFDNKILILIAEERHEAIPNHCQQITITLKETSQARIHKILQAVAGPC